MSETITMKMRGRPVTHDEAEASAQRLINSHFHNDDRARVSIPARPDNDDVLVMDYIMEQREPAEPVIEVAPGEPTPEQVEKHIFQKWSGVFERLAAVPAVPAQEAPRGDMCEGCGLEPSVGASADDVLLCQKCLDLPPDDRCVHGVWDADHCYQCDAEPQAGAQVPSQWIVANSLPGTVRNLAHLCVVLAAALRLADEHISELADAWERGALSEHDGLGGTRSNRNSDVRKAIRVALSEGPEETQVSSQDELLDEGGLSVNDLGLMLAKERTEFVALQAQLNSIKSYATEAAKTPITREDMHDPLKAQTFYDEAKGFERLVLSEIGGPK